MKLWICEKPSQARDIAAVLGEPKSKDGYIETKDGTVTYAFGHLLEFAPPEHYDPALEKWKLEGLPIFPKDWQRQPRADAKKQLKLILSLIKKAKEIVIATDAGREGEAIAREMIEQANYRGPIKRLWLSALDKETIIKGLAALRDGKETEGLYRAAVLRSKLDWLDGMNLSRACTLHFQGKIGGPRQVFSVGRVQTATLALIVDRDEEIANFRPRTYYDIEATLRTLDGQHNVLFRPTAEDKIFERSIAEKITSEIRNCKMPIKVTKQSKKKATPPLFALSDLLAKASSLWGWPVKKTQDMAQALYEKHKVATYPRTDCRYLADDQAKEIDKIITSLDALGGRFVNLTQNDLSRPVIFNSKKLSDHHAIIPTGNLSKLSELNSEERQLFELIAERYVANLMPDFEYELTTILAAPAGYEFKAIGISPINLGWKKFMSADQEDQEEEAILPPLVDGSLMEVTSSQILEKKTKAPPAFTEGSLILAMKNIGGMVEDKSDASILKQTGGLGTEATREAIIETLKRRGYVTSKKTITSTPLARQFIQALKSKIPDFLDPVKTAKMEELLAEVASTNKDTSLIVTQYQTRITQYLGSLNGANSPTPQ